MALSKPVKLRVEVPGEGYHRQLISCQLACPVNTDARGYVRAIAEGRFEEAYLIARGPNPFASICGRICGAPCEAACRRGKVPRVDDDGRLVGQDRPLAIRALKRFACQQAGVEARPPEKVLEAARAGQLEHRSDGGSCESCHEAQGWRPSTFTAKDNARLQLSLQGLHREVACAACHGPETFRPATVDVDLHGGFGYHLEGARRAVPSEGCHRELKQPPAEIKLLRVQGRGHRLAFQETHHRCEDCHVTPHGGPFNGRKDRGA